MKLAELQIRIAKGEDLHTDFKERFSSNRELAKDLVCFANTDGGQLIFGISSDKHIVGVGGGSAGSKRVAPLKMMLTLLEFLGPT